MQTVEGFRGGMPSLQWPSITDLLLYMRAGPVLMHSTNNAMGGCPEALKRLIPYWRSHGYKFVKVGVVLSQLAAPAAEHMCTAALLPRIRGA